MVETYRNMDETEVAKHRITEQENTKREKMKQKGESRRAFIDKIAKNYAPIVVCFIIASIAAVAISGYIEKAYEAHKGLLPRINCEPSAKIIEEGQDAFHCGNGSIMSTEILQTSHRDEVLVKCTCNVEPTKPVAQDLKPSQPTSSTGVSGKLEITGGTPATNDSLPHN